MTAAGAQATGLGGVLRTSVMPGGKTPGSTGMGPPPRALPSEPWFHQRPGETQGDIGKPRLCNPVPSRPVPSPVPSRPGLSISERPPLWG